MSEPLAAGIHALAVPGLAGGFAAVLGAHRFLHNDNVTLPHLVEPLHQLARQWRQQAPDAWGLVVHDWSALKYPGHARKADQTRLTNRRSRGYELTTLLLVDGRHGDPIAPLEVRSAPPARSTAPASLPPEECVPPRRGAAVPGGRRRPGPGRPAGACHRPRSRRAGVVPRLAGRRPAAGRHFLVRAKDGRKVRWQGQEQSLAEVAR